MVAVVGDGALTGGMAWEALNNIAAAEDRRLVIVVNDNGRSYAPTIGGLADHLATLRHEPGYERVLDRVKRSAAAARRWSAGRSTTRCTGSRTGSRTSLAPQGMFEDLGLKYVGPVDGHDIAAVERRCGRPSGFGGPVIVHCRHPEGRGYPPAENDERTSSTRVGDRPRDRAADRRPPAGHVDRRVRRGDGRARRAERPDVVAITAAMLGPTGLAPFAAAFPDRVFDVGIAEQHAVTSAAGLAIGGPAPGGRRLRDVPEPRLRPGADGRRAAPAAGSPSCSTGPGSPGRTAPATTACGTCRSCGVVPGLRIAAPRDAATLRRSCAEAVAVDDGPTVCASRRAR